MSTHRTGTREQWLAARELLLVQEKVHTRRGEELARQRRELPWLPVEKDYRFTTEHGPKTLAELFDGRSQLVVYHFMFGPDGLRGWVSGVLFDRRQLQRRDLPAQGSRRDDDLHLARPD